MSKMMRLWATKTKNDEWWSSFVTAPLGILANYWAVEVEWITPNRITAASFVIAVISAVCIIIGGVGFFIAAAVLIHLSHALDCMDGQMARYRNVSSPVGSYADRLTDQIQVIAWFGACGYAAYAQTESVLPVFLAGIGISFYELRGYAKYVAHEIETGQSSVFSKATAERKSHEPLAGLGFGAAANFTWFVKEQRKVLAFDEGVFIFLLSVALIFDQLVAMLWIFAVSQLFWGSYKSWQRGRNIDANHKRSIPK